MHFRLMVALLVGIGLSLLSARSAAAGSLEVWPTASLSESYSDNLQLTPSPTIADATTNIIGGGSVMLQTPARMAQLNYQTDLQVYAQHSSFNRFFQDQLADLRDFEDLSRTTELSFHDSFYNGQNSFGQSLIGAGGVSPLLGQALQQSSVLTNYFDTHLHHSYSELVSSDLNFHQTYFYVSQGVTNFFGSQSATTVSTNQGGSLVFYREITPRLKLGAGYDFEDFRFSNAPRGEDHQPSIYFRLLATPALSLDGQLGPAILQFPSRTQVEVAYSLSSTYTRGRWTASLTSGRAPNITAGFGGVSTSQYFSPSLQYRLTRRITTYANAYYNQFSGSSSGGEWLNYAAGINYQTTRHISVFAQYLGYRINNPGGLPTTSNSVFVGARITTEPWRWMWQ